MSQTRVCKECGAEFEAKNRRQVYHSKGCKWKAAHRRNVYPSCPHSRRDYMRAYRKSPTVLAAQRERQARYRHRPEVRSRQQKYHKDYRQRPESRERKRQRDLDTAAARAEEQFRIDFLRLRTILAEKLQMAAIIEARNSALAELRNLSTEQLKQELVDRLGLTAESLLRTACLVAILEERGEDLSGLKIGLLDHLRKIATGKLLPEIVVRFAGNGKMIRRISEIPLADQQRILAGADPKEVLRLELSGQRYSTGTGTRSKTVADQQDEEVCLAQRPEAVVPVGSPRDVAEYLFGLVVKHDDPRAVMNQLERLFTEWKAGGNRRRIVLAEPE